MYFLFVNTSILDRVEKDNLLHQRLTAFAILLFFQIKESVGLRENRKFWTLTPQKSQILDSFEASISKQCHPHEKTILHMVKLI